MIQTIRLRARKLQRVERRGSILLVVLVIIVLLALGAYTFTEMSVAENEATTMYGRGVMARGFAESGIDVAANSLADPAQREQADPTLNRPDLFSAIQLRQAEIARGRGRFSVITGQEHDLTGSSTRFGLTDETGKLNVNAVLLLVAGSGSNADQTAHNFFMQIPNMTNDVADAILDWIDSDDTPRQFGAESDYYQALPQPYHTANTILTSLDDLLFVRGVTPALLYGEDLNRNGIMDPGEDLNGDGYFDRGWSGYMTVYSAERNLQINGTPRVNVNQANLPQLYQQLQGLYGDPTATFVVAYRMSGAYSASKQSGNGGGGGSSGGSRFANTNTVTLGGMAVPQALSTSHTVQSLYQLIGIQVHATVNGKKNTSVTNPWKNGLSNMAQYLPDMVDKLSLVDDPFVQGRINVNQAPYEVLMGVPNMTDQLARQIVGAQNNGAASSVSGSAQSSRATTAWLVLEGLVSSASTMAQIDPYLTARGAVYRAQSVGYFDEGGPFVRLEAVIDGSIDPPRIVTIRDLTELGRGFTRQQLGVP
jgi:type II secretory pathway component PulK